jgi:hypothetical protein
MKAHRQPILALVSTFALTFSALTFLAPSAGATDRLVPDEFTSIQAAIDASAPGDEVHVSSAGSPYFELVNLIDGVSVLGGYSPDFLVRNPLFFETTIQSNVPDESVVEAIDVGASVTFDGFTITGGNSTFSGGGMFCGANSALTVSNCKFVRNFAFVTGGGLQLSGNSTAVIRQCLFQQNTSGARGGGLTAGIGTDGALIELCTVEACTTGTEGAAPGGGGVYLASGVRFERNKIRQNYSIGDGGGLYVDKANIHAWGNLFTENRAEGNGGGVYHNEGTGEHNGSLIEDCVAGVDGTGNGGGLYFFKGSSRWFTGFIRGNTATGSGSTGLGGGVYFDQSVNCLVRWTEITQNNAPKGAGVYMAGPASGAFSTAYVQNCTIAFNTSPGASGGGIHASGQEIGEVVNNVISHQLDGFGIACNSPAMPNIRFNDVYNSDAVNLDAEYGVDCPDRTGINGNIKVDPLFCNIVLEPFDLAVAGNSPVLGVGEGGADMGAHDASVACGTISVEESSWGKIKSLYR